MGVRGLRRSKYPHLVTVHADGWAMYQLLMDAIAWIEERAGPSEYDYCQYTLRADFVFKDATLAFEFKMRWG